MILMILVSFFAGIKYDKHCEQFQETRSPILLELPVWLQTCYHDEKLAVELSDCFLETYSLTSYGSGWRKAVVLGVW